MEQCASHPAGEADELGLIGEDLHPLGARHLRQVDTAPGANACDGLLVGGDGWNLWQYPARTGSYGCGCSAAVASIGLGWFTFTTRRSPIRGHAEWQVRPEATANHQTQRHLVDRDGHVVHVFPPSVLCRMWITCMSAVAPNCMASMSSSCERTIFKVHSCESQVSTRRT